MSRHEATPSETNKVLNDDDDGDDGPNSSLLEENLIFLVKSN